jgi:membrane-associated phospholipid phosphatase
MNTPLKNILVVIALLFSDVNFAQSDSSALSKQESYTSNNLLFDKMWAPATLGILSISLMTDSSKYGLQSLIRQPFNNFNTEADDYLQYAPIGIMYLADLFKIKSKNTVWNQTKFLVISELGTAIIIQVLKYTLRIERPDQSANNSYPSGHTGQAFVASQVLYNEFRATSPALAYSGFLFSVSTGALRIVNNHHWLPDVLLGAGIGMLVTNLVYFYEPLKSWNPFSKMKRKMDGSFIPVWNSNYIGGQVSLKF